MSRPALAVVRCPRLGEGSPTGAEGCACGAGALCDYCTPQKAECTEPGAQCVVTNAHETFCGRDCTTQPCPGGYTCMMGHLKVGTTAQCIPDDMSCYY